ncbi:MAG: hydroxymethylglutaryl-CoA synthase, partial [Halobacteriota archaeon]
VYTDALRDSDRYKAWYAERIRPTLRISREVGNWYTGSVHVARASALLHALEHDRDIVGEQMIVGSYGSGAQAEIHAETIQPNWKRAVAKLDVDEQLAGRYDLSFPEYEMIHDNHNLDLETEVEPLTTPDEEFVFAGWGPMGERKYQFVA